ncbi:Uncharacterised protein [Yersinia frederiksenii]|nr:Uncharacterised protein [Yersinia frederiksenii]
MANMLAGRAAMTEIRTDLIAGLDRIEQPVAASIDLKILAHGQARTLHDKVTFGVDHCIIADVEASQWPEKALIPPHRSIIATQLLCTSSQDQITSAIELQVGRIKPRAGQVDIAVQRTEQHIIARLKQAAIARQCNVLRHAEVQIVGGDQRP